MAMTNELDMIIETLRGVDDEMADGIMRARAAQIGSARVGEASDLEKSIRRLIEFMERNVQSSEFMHVYESSVFPDEFIRTFSRFANLVGNRKKWDIKFDFPDWSYDPVSQVAYNRDTWGNIHYGWIGRALRFSEHTLTSGAGWNQLEVHGNRHPGIRETVEGLLENGLGTFDDPRDLAAIRVGFNIWNIQNSFPTSVFILDAVRKQKLHLNTR
jgi:hypothetical protein